VVKIVTLAEGSHKTDRKFYCDNEAS
jgi:hypothetical protein